MPLAVVGRRGYSRPRPDPSPRSVAAAPVCQLGPLADYGADRVPEQGFCRRMAGESGLTFMRRSLKVDLQCPYELAAPQ